MKKFREAVEQGPVEYAVQRPGGFSARVLCGVGESGGEPMLRASYANYRIHALIPNDRIRFAPSNRPANASSGGIIRVH